MSTRNGGTNGGGLPFARNPFEACAGLRGSVGSAVRSRSGPYATGDEDILTAARDFGLVAGFRSGKKERVLIECASFWMGPEPPCTGYRQRTRSGRHGREVTHQEQRASSDAYAQARASKAGVRGHPC
ncbi:MAG: hypothetical protein RJQ03_11825, partial [Miltoncostaeaceae bacterium]